MRFVVLTFANGNKVAVNPDRVCYVSPAGSERKYAYLAFGARNPMLVQGSPEEVICALTEGEQSIKL